MPDNTLTIRIEGDATGATATFTLTEEQLKKLKSSLDDVGTAGKSAGVNVSTGAKEMEYSMMEARHGIMLTGEAIGLHIPRAVASMLASLGPVGAAMSAAFPILALYILIEKVGEFVEKLHDMKSEQDKIASGWLNYNTVVANVFDDLNDRLLKSQIKMDELRGDHLAALQKELELLDHTEMKDLVAQFDKIGKAADSALGNLKTGWYNFWDSGSEEAAKSLKHVQEQYANLMAEGKKDEAAALLAKETEEAKKHLATMVEENAERERAREAMAEQGQEAILLNRYGEKELEAQRQLIGVYEKVGEAAKKSLADAKSEGDARNAEEKERQRKEDLKNQEAELDAKKKHQETALELRRAQIKEEFEAQKIGVDEEEKLLNATYAKELVQQKKFIQDKMALLDPEKDKAQLIRLHGELLDEENKFQIKMTEVQTAADKRRQELKKKADEEAKKAAEQLKRATEELARAEEELVQSEARLSEAQSKASTSEKENAIKLQLAAHTIGQKEANEKLNALYREDANNRVLAEVDVISKIQSQEESLRAQIVAAKAAGDNTLVIQNQAKLDKLLAQENAATARIIGIWEEADKRIVQDDLKTESQREAYLNKFNAAFANSVTSVITGSERMSKIAVHAAEAMLKAFINYAIRMIEQSIIMHSVHKALAASEKSDAASTAAAKAGQAVADIPVVGPALAVVAAGTVYAAMMAFDRGGMSEGGPALLHPREAVLNPQQTQGFRQMTEAAGKGGLNSITFAPQVHVHGDFDTATHFPEIWSAFQGKVRTMGLNL